MATTNKVNPLSENIPIVDERGRPTLEFILKWAQQAANNAAPVRDVDVVFTDNTAGNASATRHGFLKKLSNVATQFLAGDGVFRVPSNVYDRSTYLPTVAGSTTVFRFVAARAFALTATTSKGSAGTAPSGGATTFTIKKNGSSIGTVVFADGVATATGTGAGATFAVDDVLTIDVGTANSIAAVALTLACAT